MKTMQEAMTQIKQKLKEHCALERNKCYIVTLMRRKKDGHPKESTFHIVIEDEMDIDNLDRSHIPSKFLDCGKVRLHVSVNRRCQKKAAGELFRKSAESLLKERNVVIPRNTTWISELMRDTGRDGKLWLLDLDDVTSEEVDDFLQRFMYDVTYHHVVKTPSGGYHVICQGFHQERLRNSKDYSKSITQCEIQKDGQLYIGHWG